MQKRIVMLSLLSFLFVGNMIGCTAGVPTEPETEGTEESASVAEPTVDAGIHVAGTVVQAAGKQVDLAEKNEYVQTIVRCHWLEKNKIAMEGSLSGTNSQPLYFAVYDVVRELYVYEQYGKQFIWQNDDLDTLIYVVDYSKAGETSCVRNKKDVLLYETGTEECVQNVSYVPKGIKVEVSDLHGQPLRQVVVETAA